MKDEKRVSKIKRRDFLKVGIVAAAAASASAGGSLFFSSCGPDGSTADYDVIIKNGAIYDGTLSPPFSGDIGILGDKIVAIGVLSGRAARIIDASGLIVTPGFIDVHTHCDLTFQRLGFKKNLAYVMPSFKGNYSYLYQGVTTVVTGNCGLGYTNIDQWFDLVKSVGFGTNVYHLVPHGMVRAELFGDDQPTELSQKQLDAMKNKIEEAMGMGAVGMSTGLEYSPGFLTTTDELIELMKIVGKYGGLYATHMRNESGMITEKGNFAVIDSIDEVARISEESGAPAHISHLKVESPINGATARDVLSAIERARARGLNITADQYPYNAGSTDISILLPATFIATEGIKDKYRTGAGRDEIRAAIAEVYQYLGPDKILISTMQDGNADYEGKTIAEIAEMAGKDPADVYTELVCDLDTLPIGVFFSQDMDIVKEISRSDFVMTASDGWTVPKGMTKPHPRLYGTFPKKIREFALNEKLMTFPEAIRSMTSLPAEKFKLAGRGKIALGNFADIAVIDINTITDRATFLDPHQYAEGVRHLFVNGVPSIENGVATGKRGGRSNRRA